MKTFFVTVMVMMLSATAFAGGSSSKRCESANGDLIIVDGDIHIVDGIGEIGGPAAELVLEVISDVTESCIDGLPEYSQTVMTREVIAHHSGEEPNHTETQLEIVTCVEVRTGTAACSK